MRQHRIALVICRQCIYHCLKSKQINTSIHSCRLYRCCMLDDISPRFVEISATAKYQFGYLMLSLRRVHCMTFIEMKPRCSSSLSSSGYTYNSIFPLGQYVDCVKLGRRALLITVHAVLRVFKVIQVTTLLIHITILHR